jgi:hypothetical protein
MKLLFLPLLLVTATFGYSQSIIDSSPETLTFQNIVLEVWGDPANPGAPGVPNIPIDVSTFTFTKTGSADHGPNDRTVFYTATQGSINLGFQIQEGDMGMPGFTPPYTVRLHYEDSAAGQAGSVWWGGEDLSSMSEVPWIVKGAVVSAPVTFGSENYINGLGPNGYPVGGSLSSMGGDVINSSAQVFFEQAQELNSGLEFNNGQWFPAP